MVQKIKKLKKIRFHSEGRDQLFYGAVLIILVALLLWFGFSTKIPFIIFLIVFGTAYGLVVNFYRCPIRHFPSEETDDIVVAPADGKVKLVKHFNGNHHKAWLPKASEENEHADILLTTTNGHDVLCRQIAGAMARRVVTYAVEGEDCFIDEHLGFIKLGSRVDVYLPLDSEVCVKMNQPTTGDQTVIAKLK